MKYRIFTNDVGPHGYSAFKEVEASSQKEADTKAVKLTMNLALDYRRKDPTLRVLVIPSDKIDESFTIGSGMSPTGLRLSHKFTGKVIETQEVAS